MNELENEQTGAPLTAEENKDVGEDAAVSLGKFKNVDALLNAYNSLQAEFTKRCQRIKELEAARAAVDKVTPTEAPENADKQGITEEDKQNFIKGYLKDILGAKSKAIVMDGSGTGIKTPVKRPVSVEEAGRLAKELLGK